jgi:hypothetical protein
MGRAISGCVVKMENMSTIIIENQYFGSINYINTLFQFSNVKIEQYETYQKMSFRNRCIVAGSNGLVHLSVPLEKGRNGKQLMKDTRISYSGRWQSEHLRTIESCYSRAPFFEFYFDGARKLIEQKQVFLIDLNLSILEWLKKILLIPGVISLTQNYLSEYPAGVTDFRNHILPKNFQDHSLLPRYIQVFEDRIGFQPNLCVLDLLFCTGPGARDLLVKTK